MAKEEVIYEKEENGDKKIDVMKGKNNVKINPSLGESIRAELDALKAKKVKEEMSAPKPTGPSPQEKQMLANKDKMLKKKIMMQKQAMQMQKQGKLALNYSEECEGDGKSKMKKKDLKDEDPRSQKINLAKNKLRSMGLKMSYDMEGNMTEGLSVGQQMKISQDYNRMTPEQKKAANKKAMGNVKKVAPNKDTRTDSQKMADAYASVRKGPLGATRAD